MINTDDLYNACERKTITSMPILSSLEKPPTLPKLVVDKLKIWSRMRKGPTIPKVVGRAESQRNPPSPTNNSVPIRKVTSLKKDKETVEFMHAKCQQRRSRKSNSIRRRTSGSFKIKDPLSTISLAVKKIRQECCSSTPTPSFSTEAHRGCKNPLLLSAGSKMNDLRSSSHTPGTTNKTHCGIKKLDKVTSIDLELLGDPGSDVSFCKKIRISEDDSMRKIKDRFKRGKTCMVFRSKSATEQSILTNIGQIIKTFIETMTYTPTTISGTSRRSMSVGSSLKVDGEKILSVGTKSRKATSEVDGGEVYDDAWLKSRTTTLKVDGEEVFDNGGTKSRTTTLEVDGEEVFDNGGTKSITTTLEVDGEEVFDNGGTKSRTTTLEIDGEEVFDNGGTKSSSTTLEVYDEVFGNGGTQPSSTTLKVCEEVFDDARLKSSSKALKVDGGNFFHGDRTKSRTTLEVNGGGLSDKTGMEFCTKTLEVSPHKETFVSVEDVITQRQVPKILEQSKVSTSRIINKIPRNRSSQLKACIVSNLDEAAFDHALKTKPCQFCQVLYDYLDTNFFVARGEAVWLQESTSIETLNKLVEVRKRNGFVGKLPRIMLRQYTK